MARTWFESPYDSAFFDGPEWSRCEGLIHAFENALRSGDKPSISEYLGVDGPERRALLLELIHVELEFRLKDGQLASVETYLEKHSELTDDRRATLELIASEFTLRQRHQGEVALEEYRSRFPQYFDDLKHRLNRGSENQEQSDEPPPNKSTWPVVPGYEIIRELGRGGMGVVFRAKDLTLGRDVALKFLPSDYSNDRERLERFLREARTASALNHPSICTIHTLGSVNGLPFIVMELIEGTTLKTLADRRPAIAEIVRIMGQTARALTAAHQAGVVHRDIKPDNIMVREDGYVKVLDFGLARRLPSLQQHDDKEKRATNPGALLGTMSYMSPEQAHGAPAEQASDIFALGIVLYELAAGTHPFEAESGFATLYAISTRHPAPPSRLNVEITGPLEALIEAMLRKDPQQRPTAAEVEASLSALSRTRVRITEKPLHRRAIVRRDAELAALCAYVDAADGGRGSIVCVAGDAGIGKTTLVEDFLQDAAARPSPSLIARGQCSERLAGAEAYAPVIEALTDLVRGDESGSVVRLLKVVAPSWYVRVARDAISAETSRPASQQALLREFCTFLQELSHQGAIVLFLDDIHYADISTIDLIAHFGRRCESLRALLLLTYRPTDLLLGPHPFNGIKLELQGRGVCTELSLGFLQRADIDQYLSLAFPGHAFPTDFAALIFSRTEGRPLFMTEAIRYLRERGVIAESNGRWALVKELPDVWQELPESVRGMIKRKLERLGEADRRLLAVASVQGQEFDSAVLADVLQMDAADVEEQLLVLDRVYAIVRRIREYEFPDGALTVRYGFVHSLYHNAVHTAIQPSRKATWSGAAAASLLQHHAGVEAAVATELAMLLEAARDPARSIEYYLLAAQNAVRIFAHQEAVTLARRGLALLPKLSDQATKRICEFRLLVSLGVSLVSTQGFASPEVEQTYMRARALCETGDIDSLFPVLYGLWNVYLVRCQLRHCEELAMQMFSAAKGHANPLFTMIAHNVRQQPLFHMGELVAARHHQQQGIARYDAKAHRAHSAQYGEDSGVGCLAYSAPTLWHLGYPEQALASIRAARKLADETSDPFNVAQALYFGTVTHLCRREFRQAEQLSDALVRLCGEQGFVLLLAGGMILHGRCLTALAQKDDGIRQMSQGLSDWKATGALSHRPFQLAMLAESLANNGQTDEASAALEEALTICAATGERFWEAELSRLEGEMTSRRAASDRSLAASAEASFHRARDIAQRQQARSLELRALMSLSRFYLSQEQTNKAHALLAETLGWFTEGFDAPDLQEARTLLEVSLA